MLGVSPTEQRIVVTRIVDASGRSRARIDGRPVTLRNLQRFGELLIEIHAQGSNRSLMRAATQTELLDAFAGTTDMRRAFAKELRAARDIAARLDETRAGARERRERIEFLRFCLDEIGRVDPQPGEHAALVAEARILGNLDSLRGTIVGGLDLLHEGEQRPVVEALGAFLRELEAAQEHDARLADPVRLVSDSMVLLQEAVRELHAANGRLDLNPARAVEVTERLDAMDRLLERFGPTEDELFASRVRMQRELTGLEGPEADPDRLEAQLAAHETSLSALGQKLTRKRRAAARRLAKAMVTELADLGMSETRVDVSVGGADRKGGASILDKATELGPGEVDVQLAPNPGEPMTSLRETASGGEVARVMLVLKKILADADCVPVLVFDEADAEIGGRRGIAVGRKLRAVAKRHQVISVTHLPQIAAFADAHVFVEKVVRREGGEERTVSELRLLDQKDRTRELASMTRGEAGVDERALAEADRLLELAQKK